jgi:beta-glucanase (GH16 family)
MKYIYIITIIVIFSQCTQEQDYLIWSDEFEGNEFPDTTNWNVAEGNGCPELCGFGNNEKQFYTKNNENLRLQDGKLIINALKDEEKGYTSAKLTTKDLMDWRYAYIEVRAKLPKGKGSWPAIWMLPTVEGNM